MASAISATIEPMAPRPTMPSVLPLISPPAKRAFFLFQQGGHLGGVRHVGERLNIGHAGQDAARGQQHAGHDQFLHRVGVGARCVEHHDAQLAVLGNRHVVDACAGTRHGQQRLGHRHALQLLAAQQEGIGVADVAADFIGLARKPVQALDRDLIVGSDFVHGGAFCFRR
jgi:hypothetical protein